MTPPGLLDLIGIRDWPAFVLVSARISGLFLAAPLWSMAGMPRSLRAGLAVVLSVVLLPLLPAVQPLPDDMMAMSVILAGETVLGIAIGLTGAVVLHAVTVAGEVTSLQMGLSLGQALGALPEGATVGVGQLQGYFALTIYLSLGGHLTLYEGLAASLRAIPPGQAAAGLLGGREVVALAATVFSGGIRTAAPIIVALLLANLALAILGKAVPQLNVMLVSFPITIAVGLVMLGASLPFLAAHLSRTVEALPAWVGQTIEAFTPAPAAR
jgi:flagellar biosynthetic protein FliR